MSLTSSGPGAGTGVRAAGDAPGTASGSGYRAYDNPGYERYAAGEDAWDDGAPGGSGQVLRPGAYRRMGGGGGAGDGSSGSGSGPPSIAGSDAARTPLTGRSPSQRSGGGSAGPRRRSAGGGGALGDSLSEGDSHSDGGSEYEIGEEEEGGKRRRKGGGREKSIHDILVCWPLGWPRMSRVEWQLCLLIFWFLIQLLCVILLLTSKQFPWEYDYIRDLRRGERDT